MGEDFEKTPLNPEKPCNFDISVTLIGLVCIRCLRHGTKEQRLFRLCFDRLWPRLDKFFAGLNTGASFIPQKIDDQLELDKTPLRDDSIAYS